jgi:hypothetical protein
MRAPIWGFIERDTIPQVKESVIRAPEVFALKFRRTKIRAQLANDRALSASLLARSRHKPREHFRELGIPEEIHDLRRRIQKGVREDLIQASPHRGVAHTVPPRAADLM